jgi:hypothetical protein
MGQVMTRVPRQPSNRSVYEQMIAWGWKPGKTDGSWQSMFSPPIGTKQVRLRVRPPQQHDANPATVFKEIYRLTTGGDPELFWRGPSDTWLQMLANEQQLAEKRKQDEYEASLTRAAARAEAQAAAEAAKNQPVRILAVAPEPRATARPGLTEEGRKRMGKRTIHTITSKDVLEVLTAHDGPMTCKSIAKALGLDASADADGKYPVSNKISNACRYLVDCDLAERVMNGTYRVTSKAKTINARVQHDGIHEDHSGIPAVNAPPEAARPVVARVAESVDDVIEAVLDLLLPQGFKASHLRFIAPWVETTKRMVAEVDGG